MYELYYPQLSYMLPILLYLIFATLKMLPTAWMMREIMIIIKRRLNGLGIFKKLVRLFNI
jgi:hypothetical protein